MANADRPFGLRPVRHRNGHPWNGAVRPYYITATDGTALFIGDPVDIVGDSNDSEVTVIGGKFAPGSLSEVTRATAGDGNRITGVVTGIMPTTRDSTIYRAASTEAVLLVCDDPSVIFQIQDDAGAALSTDTVGLNANLTAGTGSTVTGLSAFELAASAPGADASNQLFIDRLANLEEENTASGGNAVWEVWINLHRFADTGTATQGGALGVA